MNIFDRYYQDALRIYAICGDEALSDDEARLLTYMHVKATESKNGVDYFDNPSEHDEAALDILAGATRFEGRLSTDNGESVALADSFASGVGNHLMSLDNGILREEGFENRISGELRHRKRLYSDKAFCAKMKSLYTEKIAPRIFSESAESIDRSFRRFRENVAHKEQDLDCLLDY